MEFVSNPQVEIRFRKTRPFPRVVNSFNRLQNVFMGILPSSRRAYNVEATWKAEKNPTFLAQAKENQGSVNLYPNEESGSHAQKRDADCSQNDSITESQSGTKAIGRDDDMPSQLARAKLADHDRLNPKKVFSSQALNSAVQELNKAMDYHQNDNIVNARKIIKRLFENMSRNQAWFKFSTKYALHVLLRGREIFLEEGVSCSIKHGTLLLDSSTRGAPLYFGLLNVLAAFALLISEFEIAEKTFDLLIKLHGQSSTTSLSEDLGATHNNKGCVLLVFGHLREAEKAFETSLGYFGNSNRSSVAKQVFVVKSNMSRLNLDFKKYRRALELQMELVEKCEATEMKDLPYAFETVFTVMNNQAVLHTTLENFSGAEHALRWLITYCKDRKRKDSEYLVNFLHLHLSEVLLLHGKSKEANEVFSIETLKTFEDIVNRFEDLYFNVGLEALEKLIELFVRRGKMKAALQHVQTSVKILKIVFGPDHFNIASLLCKQGKILSLMGEVSQATKMFKFSIEILRKIFGEKNPLLLKCYMSLGYMKWRINQEESHLFFQRATENIEGIYQVSFVNELAMKYLEMIRDFKTLQRPSTSEDRLEGLVAEYGMAVAFLLNHHSNRHLTECRADRKLTTVKNTEGQVSESIVSLRYSSDFIKSGQKFLCLGMTNEAAVFFRQAELQCGVHVIHSKPGLSVARLYSLFLKEKFGGHGFLKHDHGLRKFLKDLTNVIEESGAQSIVKRTQTVESTMKFDFQPNMRLVLVLLLLFALELKMIETTFAAYDLYSRLFQNETDFPFLLLDGIQVYASKVVITCNGETAVQDILISSEIGPKETNAEPSSTDTDGQLFRSLAYKENAPRNAFLVTGRSPVLLDIGDLNAAKEKISLAVLDCFQMKCLEGEAKGSATQVIVDLTPTTRCGNHDILSTYQQIELLPLCLSAYPNDEIAHNETIFEMDTAIRQRVTQRTFGDKQTSSFLFNKTALSLLRRNDPGKLSSMVLLNDNLSLTVRDPERVRLTLSRSDKGLTQRIQHVTAKASPIPLECSNNRRQASLTDACVLPDVNPSEKRYQVPSQRTTLSEVPLNDLTALGCNSDSLIDECQVTGKSSPLHCEEDNGNSKLHDQQELSRTYTDDSALECLTIISEITRQILEEASDEDSSGSYDSCYQSVGDQEYNSREDGSSLMCSNVNATRCLATNCQSQVEQERFSTTSQHLTATPQVNYHGECLTLTANDCSIVGESLSSHEEESMLIEDGNEMLRGKRLFEDHRKSRLSFITDIHEKLRKKQLNCTEGNSVRSDSADGSHLPTLHSSPTHYGSDCSKLELQHRSPETQAQSKTAITGKIGSYENNQIVCSRVGKKETTDDKPLVVNQLTQDTTITNVQDRNDLAMQPKCELLEEERSRLPRTTPEKVYTSTVPNDEESFTFLKGNTCPEQNIKSSKHQNIKETNRETFVPNVEAQDAVGVDKSRSDSTVSADSKINFQQRRYLQEEQRKMKSGKHHLSEGIKGIKVEIRENETDTLEKQGTSCSDFDDMTTERIFEPLIKDVLPNGTMNKDTSRSQNNVVDLQREKDSVDGPNLREENETRSLNQSLRKVVPIDLYGQIHFKSQATFSNRHETTSRSMSYMGDVVADGESRDNNLNNVDTVDGPALTQNPHKEFHAGEKLKTNLKCISVTLSNENGSHTDRDAVCEYRYPPVTESKLFQSHSSDGGARPKQRLTDNAKSPLPLPIVKNPLSAHHDLEIINTGLDPVFMARHVKESSPFLSFHNGGNYNRASLDGPWEEDYEQDYFVSNAHDQFFKAKGQNSYDKDEFISHDIANRCDKGVPVNNASVIKNFSVHHVSPPNGDEKESWHFPSSESCEDTVLQSECFSERTNESNPTSLPKSFDANREKLFSVCGSVCAYNDMDSMANEYSSGVGRDECEQSLPMRVSEYSLASSLGYLQEIMAKTIRIVVSNATRARETEYANQSVENTGVEETGDMGEGESAVTQSFHATNSRGESIPSNETTVEAERQPMATPVQESPRPVCSHYQRRCLVRFPCCGKFFPCHRCHNESDCSEDQARAINATHIRCTICYHEQEIDENGQRCGGCNAIMSEYFCSTCRHYTSVDKNPFHCEKCGICRIHKDRSFHCDVCNVCLDKRLEGKHKCRPDSGHDECCICLEDAFSGCQILPCSHKVHKDCAIAMIQNGVRKCPICRHPLFGQLQNSTQ
ncbi:uncharacterized protein LOC111340075 isoform X2 [Stylophora pistillata]|uniref:uncharacterized protein LOC111340075 isoform X2 n=1 Tax=Stylophora pistillata TaxID=50429 RepID=UPI000C056A38|nr:uncharacterized protein LOC111340075 isoform X2 [Stylophora pistillata]